MSLEMHTANPTNQPELLESSRQISLLEAPAIIDAVAAENKVRDLQDNVNTTISQISNRLTQTIQNLSPEDADKNSEVLVEQALRGYASGKENANNEEFAGLMQRNPELQALLFKRNNKGRTVGYIPRHDLNTVREVLEAADKVRSEKKEELARNPIMAVTRRRQMYNGEFVALRDGIQSIVKEKEAVNAQMDALARGVRANENRPTFEQRQLETVSQMIQGVARKNSSIEQVNRVANQLLEKAKETPANLSPEQIKAEAELKDRNDALRQEKQARALETENQKAKHAEEVEKKQQELAQYRLNQALSALPAGARDKLDDQTVTALRTYMRPDFDANSKNGAKALAQIEGFKKAPGFKHIQPVINSALDSGRKAELPETREAEPTTIENIVDDTFSSLEEAGIHLPGRQALALNNLINNGGSVEEFAKGLDLDEAQIKEVIRVLKTHSPRAEGLRKQNLSNSEAAPATKETAPAVVEELKPSVTWVQPEPVVETPVIPANPIDETEEGEGETPVATSTNEADVDQSAGAIKLTSEQEDILKVYELVAAVDGMSKPDFRKLVTDPNLNNLTDIQTAISNLPGRDNSDAIRYLMLAEAIRDAKKSLAEAHLPEQAIDSTANVESTESAPDSATPLAPEVMNSEPTPEPVPTPVSVREEPAIPSMDATPPRPQPPVPATPIGAPAHPEIQPIDQNKLQEALDLLQLPADLINTPAKKAAVIALLGKNYDVDVFEDLIDILEIPNDRREFWANEIRDILENYNSGESEPAAANRSETKTREVRRFSPTEEDQLDEIITNLQANPKYVGLDSNYFKRLVSLKNINSSEVGKFINSIKGLEINEKVELSNAITKARESLGQPAIKASTNSRFGLKPVALQPTLSELLEEVSDEERNEYLLDAARALRLDIKTTDQAKLEALGRILATEPSNVQEVSEDLNLLLGLAPDYKFWAQKSDLFKRAYYLNKGTTPIREVNEEEIGQINTNVEGFQRPESNEPAREQISLYERMKTKLNLGGITYKVQNSRFVQRFFGGTKTFVEQSESQTPNELPIYEPEGPSIPLREQPLPTREPVMPTRELGGSGRNNPTGNDGIPPWLQVQEVIPQAPDITMPANVPTDDTRTPDELTGETGQTDGDLDLEKKKSEQPSLNQPGASTNETAAGTVSPDIKSIEGVRFDNPIGFSANGASVNFGPGLTIGDPDNSHINIHGKNVIPSIIEQGTPVIATELAAQEKAKQEARDNSEQTKQFEPRIIVNEDVEIHDRGQLLMSFGAGTEIPLNSTMTINGEKVNIPDYLKRQGFNVSEIKKEPESHPEAIREGVGGIVNLEGKSISELIELDKIIGDKITSQLADPIFAKLPPQQRNALRTYIDGTKNLDSLSLDNILNGLKERSDDKSTISLSIEERRQLKETLVKYSRENAKRRQALSNPIDRAEVDTKPSRGKLLDSNADLETALQTMEDAEVQILKSVQPEMIGDYIKSIFYQLKKETQNGTPLTFINDGESPSPSTLQNNFERLTGRKYDPNLDIEQIVSQSLPALASEGVGGENTEFNSVNFSEAQKLENLREAKREIIERAGHRSMEESINLIRSVKGILEDQEARGHGRIKSTIAEMAGTSEIIYDSGLVYIPKSDGELIVVGDLHGDMDTLKQVLEKSKFIEDMELGNKTRKLVFMGDLNDRGVKDVEVNEVVNTLITRYPENVVLIGADHEKDYGEYYPQDFPLRLIRHYPEAEAELVQKLSDGGRNFYEALKMDREGQDRFIKTLDTKVQEAINRYGIEFFFFIQNKEAFASVSIMSEYLDLYGKLPSFIVCGNGVTISHAGIPESYTQNLSTLKNNNKSFHDMRWSDPTLKEIKKRHIKPNQRGGGVVFDEKAFEAFLNAIGANVMVTGHRTTETEDQILKKEVDFQLIFDDRFTTTHSSGRGSATSHYAGREPKPSYNHFRLNQEVKQITRDNIVPVW